MIVGAAASGRIWADLLASLGWLKRPSGQAVQRSHQVIQTIYLTVMLAVFVGLQLPPPTLIIFSQYVLGLFSTPLLIFGIWWMAFHTDRRLRMSRITALLLLATGVVYIVCVCLGLAVQSGLID